MNPRVGWAATLVVAALATIFFLYPGTGSPTGGFTLFLAPTYSIDSLSVYQSSSTVIGSGTAVCTGVGVTGVSASCDSNLSKSTSYRFEVLVSNSGPHDGSLERFMFQSVYAAGDVLGSNASLTACGCSDDGVDKPGTPSFSGQDANCALPVADQCFVEKLGGSEAFYFVVSTGSDPASGSGSFFVEQAGEGSDSSADVSFSYCPVACDSNSACNDGNSLTTDVCTGPGLCSAACSNTPCSIACASDSGCDDSNSSTTDVCNSPGTCAASCVHSGCSVACSSGAGCNDSNSLTIDVCSSPGTCSASCSNTVCDINCAASIDCDDSNGFTADTCSNPGTCSASCSHVSCTPACFSSSDCDDNDDSTVDICNNAGTCDANCSSSVCTPSCFNDSDCDDGFSGSVDTCIHPGKCGAHCLNEFCSPACYSDSGCDDSDDMTTDVCLNAGSCTASCSNGPCAIACSSDSDCDDSNPLTADKCSSAGGCAASCLYTEHQLSIEVADFNRDVGRGQAIDLNVLVKGPDGSPIEGAQISLVGPSGARVDLNSVGNGFYVGKYTVPVDLALGTQNISFSASSAGLTGLKQVSLEVRGGSIRAVLLEPSEPKASIGEKLQFGFRLVYEDGSPALDADANAALNGVSIPLVKTPDGVFTGHYVFSEADLEQAVLVVSAADAFGNSGTTSLPFSVQQPVPLLFIALLAVSAAAVVLAFYGLGRTRVLSSLLGKRGAISLSMKKKQLLGLIERDKVRVKALEKEIEAHEVALKEVGGEIEAERRKQALAVKRIPSESRYAARKAAVGFSAKLKRLFGSRVSGKEMQTLKRIEKIDLDISTLRGQVQALEAEYCRKSIKEDAFRQKLFDLREKIHLLELERKKIE